MTIDSHRINLLPRAVRVKREGRQFVSVVLAAGVGLVVLLGFLWFQKGQQISSTRSAVAAQKATNAKIQAEINKLDYIEAKQQAVLAKEALVKDSWTGEISWYRLLQDVATTMPSQTWLTSFQAQGTAGSGSSSTAGATGQKVAAGAAVVPDIVVSGNFTVSGVGFDHPDSADWLARISQMREVVDLWLTQSTASAAADSSTQRTVSFNSNGSITQEAWSFRAKRAAEGNLYEGTNAQ